MSSTAKEPASLVLRDAEKRIVESIRIARSTTRTPQRSRYIINLAADALSTGEKIVAVRQVLALLKDAFDRGANEGDLLAVADQLRSEIESWYELQRGMIPNDLAALRAELAESHLAEETTEAEKDIAETILAHHMSPGAAQRLIRTDAAHAVAGSRLVRCARKIMRSAAAL